MVKRHETFRERHKTLKDLPLYQRYVRQTQIICWIIPLAIMFGPPLYRFLYPASLDELNPRSEGDIRELKKKFKLRERSFLEHSFTELPDLEDD